MTTTYDDILRLLLNALHWKGTERDIIHALPFPTKPLKLHDFRDVMARLGYASIIRRTSVSHLKSEFFPVIYIDANHNPQLLRSQEDITRIKSENETFILFHAVHHALDDGSTSLRYELRRFSPLFRQIILLSLFINSLAIVPIFFNRTIYDHIIASGSTKGLGMLIFGVMIALLAELTLRKKRNFWLGFFGGRIDHFVSSSVFERLMFLSPIYTERASVSAQLTRLRDFENVREFFTGPLASLLFEIPLVFIYLIAMAAIAHWLTLVPIALMLFYAALIFLTRKTLKEHSRTSSNFATQKQEFLLETVTKLHEIRLAGIEQVWLERYRALSGQASLAAFRASFWAQTFETSSYVLMMLGGIATLSFGVMAVIQQYLTVGALISAMMLTWRIIAPLQIFCASMTRIQQLTSSIRQVERLLAIPPERDPHTPPPILPHIKGRVSFHRVSLRYSQEHEPAILGVSFDIKPGQIVAIQGGNGSGKSSLLKLVLGLYQPQGGSVRIDGIDIRQFDPIALRQAISYVPQFVDFFPGTIRDNLIFSNPCATEEMIEKALREACASEETSQLPSGLDTVIVGDRALSISYLLRQRLNLARAYLKDTPIMLFDEAAYSLGHDNDLAFMEKIHALRGKSTVLLVTHREDHIKLADMLLVLDKGELTHAGPPEQVLNVLRGKKA